MSIKKKIACILSMHNWTYDIFVETRWCIWCNKVQIWCHEHEQWEDADWTW